MIAAPMTRALVRPAGAHVGKGVLGRMAERLEPAEIEEAAIAFDGMDEAEDGIEPRAVVGLGFPSDDLPAQGLEHLPAFRYEIGNQIVHRRNKAPAIEDAYAGQELTLRYPCRTSAFKRGR